MDQKGLAPIIVIVIIVGLIGSSLLISNKVNLPISTKTEDQATRPAGLITTTPMPSVVNTPIPSLVSSPAIPQSTPIKSPTPKAFTPKTIAFRGFAYDDRTGNGVFDSDDVGLPNMEFCFFDSFDKSDQGCLFTSSDGYVSHSFYIKGNLVIEPRQYNNFTPSTTKKELSDSQQDLKFAFRSSTIPDTNNTGVLEGDFFNDKNENGVFDSGEERTYFYKLYLIDENNGHYYTVEGAQATDPSGHFKYVDLPANKTYRLVLSTAPELYKVNKTEYSFSFSPTKTSITDLKIPVVRK